MRLFNVFYSFVDQCELVAMIEGNNSDYLHRHVDIISTFSHWKLSKRTKNVLQSFFEINVPDTMNISLLMFLLWTNQSMVLLNASINCRNFPVMN